MSDCPKAVVALAGARDYYQLPLALHEHNLLQTLVTEAYWPADQRWFTATVGRWLSRTQVAARFCDTLPSAQVQVDGRAFAAALLSRVQQKPWLLRTMDRALSRRARRIAEASDSALFCYNYYASEAFKPSPTIPPYRFLFQLHPHPLEVRHLLMEEVERVPAARLSLTSEHELALPAEELDTLVAEPYLANGWVAASTHTTQTLAAHGVPREQIHVVPYGVDGERFPQRVMPRALGQPLTVIFVGSMVQRKGLSYLLDAVRQLRTSSLRLVLCGRGVIDEHLLATYSDVPVSIKVGLSHDDLVHEIHQSDLFVLPSLTEGFAHVILEVMACGLPVLTTPNTCGPDVIVEGEHGFIVPIRDTTALTARLAWALDHRADLAVLGEAAATRAREFTWARFREGIRQAYTQMVAAVDQGIAL